MNPLFAGSRIQKTRLVSGLILFAFAASHFINTALGLWSLELMEDAQAVRLAVTRSSLGSVIILAALIVHTALGLWKIATLSTWRMPLLQAVQFVFALAIPFLLLPHIIHTRIAHEVFGFADIYSNELEALWPDAVDEQSILLLLVWIHGCIGLHYWLRVNQMYRRLMPIALSLAVLIPALSIAGFIDSARDNKEARLAGNFTKRGEDVTLGKSVFEMSQAERDRLRYFSMRSEQVVVAIIGFLVAVYMVRIVKRRFRKQITVKYASGPDLTVPPGPTLLEISRSGGVPHASVCGGRARCSTCRVRVTDSAHLLPDPDVAEQKTLDRIGAPSDVRLACQIRPVGDLSVTRLIRPPSVGGRSLSSRDGDAEGAEHDLAVLFLDIRGFTAISEARLPYDTVFLLNRFFSDIGEAIGSSGGWIDKYMGDGLIALFGHNQSVRVGARAAIAACVGIDQALQRFNQEMEQEIGGPLRIAIGLHFGPLVMGRIGHESSAAMTVIGETVNIASRLEGLAKQDDMQLVVSTNLLENAEYGLDGLSISEVKVRGSNQPIRVVSIASAAETFSDLAPAGKAAA